MSNIFLTIESANGKNVEFNTRIYNGEIDIVGVEIDGVYTASKNMSSYTYFRIERWAYANGIDQLFNEALAA